MLIDWFRTMIWKNYGYEVRNWQGKVHTLVMWGILDVLPTLQHVSCSYITEWLIDVS